MTKLHSESGALPGFEPLRGYPLVDAAEMLTRVRDFAAELRRRRTVREYSPEPIPREVIEAALWAAGSAPNGANRQPWHFVAVSDPGTKARIREAAEEEERSFYGGRAPDDWLEVLRPLGTDAEKGFLEVAPWLIAIFGESSRTEGDGSRSKNYYVSESVGIATGMLIAALHRAGLATLTHTPSPMGFLNRILGRPENERAFLLLVVGRPSPQATVPRIEKRPLEAYTTFLEG